MNLFIPVSYQTLWASIDLIPKLSVLRRIPSSKDQRKMPTRTPDVPRFASRNQVRFIVNRGKPRPSNEMKSNGDPFSRIKGGRTSRANRFAGRESPGGIRGASLARLLATKYILKAARSRPRGRGTDVVERQDKEYQPGNGRCKFRVTEAGTIDPTDRRMDVHVRHNA